MNEQPSEPQVQPEPDKPRSSFHWVAAAVLIVLGVIFLLQETGSVQLGENWWVIFLFLPAAGLIYDALQRYQDGGLAHVGGQLLGGVILIVVALTFLFNWNWGVIWPVFLIIGGFYLLVQRRR
jgi:drug/metabolite transporter (DMT)-like permease